MSFLEDCHDKLSNLLEDLKMVEEFANSVESAIYSDVYSDMNDIPYR